MASSSIRPSSRYSSSVESETSPSHSSSRRCPSAAMDNSSSSSSRAMVMRTRSGDMITAAPTTNKNRNATTLGTMVKKFMEKRSGSTADRKPLAAAAAAAAAAEDMNKKNKKASNFTSLHRKLFQKGSDRPALAELKPAANARTLAMVLRSERELLTQNKDYEDEIQQLRLLLDEKNREVEKLKDLCLKQREQIKALKDAILFPDVLNSQLQQLLGSDLKQARQIIPSLQMQVSSLTGQLQCLADDLAEVKADKYGVMASFDGHISSPQTPKSDQDAQNSLEYSSGCPMTYGSPDEMFLKDLNPCLTPCFSKTKSKEFDHILGYDSPSKDGSLDLSREFIPDDFSSSQGGILSKSLEKCRRLSHGSNTARKIYKSDESKWSIGKPKHQTLSVLF